MDQYEPDLHRDIMKTVKGNFDESLLLWHIATELCYSVPRRIREDNNQTLRKDEEEQQAGGEEEENQEGMQGGGEETQLEVADLIDISKRLSDYMLYLLVLQPAVLSTIGGIGLIRYWDTCAEACRFFEMGGRNPNQKDAYEMLIEVNTEAKPAAVKGDRSKSCLEAAVKGDPSSESPFLVVPGGGGSTAGNESHMEFLSLWDWVSL